MELIKPDPLYNFAAIPGTILNYFDIPHKHLALPKEVLAPYEGLYDSVCLVFVDAFGMCFLKHYSETDPIFVLPELLKKSKLTRLTSQFPSTTAVHVTTINTGLPVAESGICEWYYYESSVDKVITPLPFTDPDTRRPNSLLENGITGTEFFSEGWFFPSLKANNIQTQIHLNNAFAPSPFNSITMTSAHSLPFETIDEGIRNLGQSLVEVSSPTYTYFYFDSFDATMHRHGPFSSESRKVIESFFVDFEQHVLRPVAAHEKKVLFLFTADHGMAPTKPETIRYVDRELPEIVTWTKKTKNGELIRPTGSKRDLFLHIQQEYLNQAFASLTELYSDIGRVFLVSDLVNQGYFGEGVITERFRANIGDILVAPFYGHGVYWAGENGWYINDHLGSHGGLSPQEMETIFLAYGT